LFCVVLFGLFVVCGGFVLCVVLLWWGVCWCLSGVVGVFFVLGWVLFLFGVVGVWCGFWCLLLFFWFFCLLVRVLLVWVVCGLCGWFGVGGFLICVVGCV
jgi:hypothetical protein